MNSATVMFADKFGAHTGEYATSNKAGKMSVLVEISTGPNPYIVMEIRTDSLIARTLTRTTRVINGRRVRADDIISMYDEKSDMTSAVRSGEIEIAVEVDQDMMADALDVIIGTFVESGHIDGVQ